MVLGLRRFVVHAFSNAQDALVHFDPRIHDLVVTDNSMAMMTGAEMAQIIKLRSPATPVLMYSGHPPKINPPWTSSFKTGSPACAQGRR